MQQLRHFQQIRLSISLAHLSSFPQQRKVKDHQPILVECCFPYRSNAIPTTKHQNKLWKLFKVNNKDTKTIFRSSQKKKKKDFKGNGYFIANFLSEILYRIALTSPVNCFYKQFHKSKVYSEPSQTSKMEPFAFSRLLFSQRAPS